MGRQATTCGIDCDVSDCRFQCDLCISVGVDIFTDDMRERSLCRDGNHTAQRVGDYDLFTFCAAGDIHPECFCKLPTACKLVLAAVHLNGCILAGEFTGTVFSCRRDLGEGTGTDGFTCEICDFASRVHAGLELEDVLFARGRIDAALDHRWVCTDVD